MTRTICLLFALPLLAAPPARFAEHTIATGLNGGYQVVVADLNHDGRPDLIALASGMPELVWYENPTWERHVIAGNQAGMINCAVVGADSEGIPEIVLASGSPCSRRRVRAWFPCCVTTATRGIPGPSPRSTAFPPRIACAPPISMAAANAW